MVYIENGPENKMSQFFVRQWLPAKTEMSPLPFRPLSPDGRGQIGEMGNRLGPLSVDANDDNGTNDDDEYEIRPPRSIDDYLDCAYRHGGDRVGRTYHVIFLALGIANSGDSAEISCTNYVLSSSSFQNNILFGDDFDM